MTYGLGTRALSEDGLETKVARANASRSPIRSWRALDEANRFALIERALGAANDRLDGFPLAL